MTAWLMLAVGVGMALAAGSILITDALAPQDSLEQL